MTPIPLTQRTNIPVQVYAPCRVCQSTMLFTLTNGRYYCNRCHIKIADVELGKIGA